MFGRSFADVILHSPNCGLGVIGIPVLTSIIFAEFALNSTLIITYSSYTINGKYLIIFVVRWHYKALHLHN
jgi:hypothetical protein